MVPSTHVSTHVLPGDHPTQARALFTQLFARARREHAMVAYEQHAPNPKPKPKPKPTPKPKPKPKPKPNPKPTPQPKPKLQPKPKPKPEPGPKPKPKPKPDPDPIPIATELARGPTLSRVYESGKAPG